MSALLEPVSKRPDRRDEGSAYVISMLVLLILSLLGLSLSLVTQTEVRVGGRERVIERTFYAAGSGLELSVARGLADGDFGPITHERERSVLEQGNLVPIKERVQSSAFICLGDTYCNLCSMNQGRQYARRNFTLAVEATRVGVGPDDGEKILGRKALSTMTDVEPFHHFLGSERDEPTTGEKNTAHHRDLHGFGDHGSWLLPCTSPSSR